MTPRRKIKPRFCGGWSPPALSSVVVAYSNDLRPVGLKNLFMLADGFCSRFAERLASNIPSISPLVISHSDCKHFNHSFPLLYLYYITYRKVCQVFCDRFFQKSATSFISSAIMSFFASTVSPRVQPSRILSLSSTSI